MTNGELQPRAERPIWGLASPESRAARDIPVPDATVTALDDRLAERVGRQGRGGSSRPAVSIRCPCGWTSHLRRAA